MSTWERVFQFSDNTQIMSLTVVNDGLIASGLYYPYAPSQDPAIHSDEPEISALLRSPEGFLCKVPFVGNDFVWFTRFGHSFIPLDHVCSDNQIFMNGIIPRITQETPLRNTLAYLQVDAQSGRALGSAITFSSPPDDAKVKWSLSTLRVNSGPIAMDNCYFLFYSAEGVPSKHQYLNVPPDFTTALPCLFTVGMHDGSAQATLLGDWKQNIGRRPTAWCVTNEGTILTVENYAVLTGLADAQVQHIVRRIVNAANPLNPGPFLPLLVPWQKQIPGDTVTCICDTGKGGFVVAGSLQRIRRWAGKDVYDNNGFVQRFDASGNSVWSIDLSTGLPLLEDPAVYRDSTPRGLIWFGNWFATWGTAPTGEMFLAKFWDKGAAPPEREWLRWLTRPIPTRPFLKHSCGVVATADGGAFYTYGQVDRTEGHSKAYIGRLGTAGEPT